MNNNNNNIIYYEIRAEYAATDRNMHNLIRCNDPRHTQEMGGFALRLLDARNGKFECCCSTPHISYVKKPFTIITRDLWQEWTEQEEQEKKKAL